MIEVPGYSITRMLGRGGMATVYLAVQESLGRQVALKVLARHGAADPAAGERFLREARIAASLHHPHIVPIHDFGVVEGCAYIAMAFEAGGSVAPGPGQRLEPAVALRIVRDIADALDYAHSRGVVHRDIKPDNILSLRDGGATLADFGIAQMAGTESALTLQGTSVGTPHYMSPEQLRGDKVDGSSDLYSLGVVMFELLTGARPYEGQDGWSIGTQHLTAEIPRLPADLGFLQALVDSLLAKSPSHRPVGARDLATRIDSLLEALKSNEPAGAVSVGQATTAFPRSPTPGGVPAGPVRRPELAWPARRAVWIGALVLVLGASLLAWGLREPAPALVQGPATSTSPTQAADTSAPPDDPSTARSRSIAVLPFADLSADGSSRYFADGISEELLNVLAKVDGMDVASRTSSFAFGADVQASAPSIADELKVRYLLQGSVRKAGNRVRINAQLVDAQRDRQLWSDTYDRQLDDIFAIQEEIATAIVTAMQIPLDVASGGRVVVVPTVTRSQRAYDDYLRARELFIARKDLGESLRLYENVTRTDPGFARAWEGLAAVAAIGTSWGLEGRDFDAIAGSAAQRALALDPSLSTPWGVLGWLEQRKRPTDWDRSLALLDRAVAADPGNATGYQWRGLAWMALGYFDKALADFDRCLRVDPAYLNCERAIALTHLYAGRREEALRLFAKTFRTGYTGRYGAFLQPMVAAGQRAQADAVLDAVGASPAGREAIFRVLASPGEPSAADREALRRYVQTPAVAEWAAKHPTRMAIWLGDYDAIDRASDVELMQLVVWQDSPPGFVSSAARTRLIQRIGLPAYWRRHGFPPQCAPDGATGFRCR